MTENRRKIGEIRIEFNFTQNEYTEKQKKLVGYCVKTCHVALSLHESVNQNVRLVF
jgi:uncharacterized OsmC-like protein